MCKTNPRFLEHREETVGSSIRIQVFANFTLSPHAPHRTNKKFVYSNSKKQKHGGINMTKKRLLTSLALVAVLGAVLLVSQVVWAAESTSKKQETSQGSQTDHAAHHPEAQASVSTTASKKMEANNKQVAMKDSNMQDMMKMMNTPEGKQLLEKCQEVLKQNAGQ
ncbi:hypothetical protein PaeBR_02115 [Paenibacillus sp. BR2-3]|uniref:hypothetical protein n=1 Tax=Paenibacillus sp. BR2-3 TaxID=3048494 RepID=UPI003977442C